MFIVGETMFMFVVMAFMRYRRWWLIRFRFTWRCWYLFGINWLLNEYVCTYLFAIQAIHYRSQTGLRVTRVPCWAGCVTASGWFDPGDSGCGATRPVTRLHGLTVSSASTVSSVTAPYTRSWLIDWSFTALSAQWGYIVPFKSCSLRFGK